MFWNKPGSPDKNVKKLSEKDIQRQLYGNYLDKVEVMDSSFIVKEKEDAAIHEKTDPKAKRELGAELEGLKGEFKRLQAEVNRLKKEKESLEHPEIWFKPPFLKAKHLVIIGSLVVLVAVAFASFFAVRFFVSKVGHKKEVISSGESKVLKKEAPPKTPTAKKPAKKSVKSKP